MPARYYGGYVLNKILITSDSSCDLSKPLLEKYNIHTSPLFVTAGNDTFLDGVSITADDLYAYVAKTGVLPKTAARSDGDYKDFFGKFVSEGYDVVHISLGSALSSSYEHACIAAENFDNVYVVDSQNLSTGTGLSVLYACDLREQGLSAAEIAEKVKQVVGRVRASFVVDSIDYLYKGGRCSAVAALGANLLRLRPSIFVVDGKMTVGKKYRGNIKTIFASYAKEQLEREGVRYNRRRVFVTHSCPDETLPDEVVAMVKASGLFDEVLVTRAGCTVSSHCGPNTLGVLYIED